MSTTINGVSARLGRDPEDFRRYLITIQVYSRTKTGLKASNDIDPGKSGGQQHLLQQIGVAGAACAEYLGETYGDAVDPAGASRDAIRAFGEECRLQIELSKSSSAKVKRLEANVSKLRNAEQELLRRLRWVIDHNEKLTPDEVSWLDQRLGELHGGQL